MNTTVTTFPAHFHVFIVYKHPMKEIEQRKYAIACEFKYTKAYFVSVLRLPRAYIGYGPENKSCCQHILLYIFSKYISITQLQSYNYYFNVLNRIVSYTNNVTRSVYLILLGKPSNAHAKVFCMKLSHSNLLQLFFGTHCVCASQTWISQ